MPPFNYDEYGNLYTHNGKRVDLAGNREDRQRKLEAMLRAEEPLVDDDATPLVDVSSINRDDDLTPRGIRIEYRPRKTDDPGAAE